MHAPELVIFDCDGVLVDTEHIALRLNLEIGPELGWAITAEEAVGLFLGRSTASVRAIIAERLGRDAAEQWDQRFIKLHHEAIERELQPVDGIREALARITLPTCVASSGSHDKMRHTLGVTGLHDHFAGRIFSATEVANGKPAPDLFLHAAERMGVPPDRCVVVEDSRYGVQAARAAGMRALGFAGGLTPRAWLEGPDTVVFDDMTALPSLLTDL
jgi:HAD superfamily hydrolase (TIGR01509 family)